MALQHGGLTTSLVSGATLGAILGIMFPPLVGPAVGMLVGVSLLDLRDARSGAWAGLLMGALSGTGLGLHALLSSTAPLPGMEVSTNTILCALVLYAILGAAIGSAGGWLWKTVQRSRGLFW